MIRHLSGPERTGAYRRWAAGLLMYTERVDPNAQHHPDSTSSTCGVPTALGARFL
jgi:hypothetical protein